jgi:hypothetical protein
MGVGKESPPTPPVVSSLEKPPPLARAMCALATRPLEMGNQ